MKLISSGMPTARAAAKVDIDPKTARKHARSGKLPSQTARPHTWRTRTDPFHDVFDEIRPLLEVNPGLLAATLFDHLQRRYPGRFQDGQLRTLQRKLKSWRVLDGPAKEVFFPQTHHPGRVAQSDFCHLSALGVTIEGVPFDHLLYHFLLPYSNWETGSLCFSESFESLAIQAAHTNPGRANENGDVEQRHHRFRTALDQALMLRGSRDFESRGAYAAFLRDLFTRLNAGRRARFQEEIAHLRSLPRTPLSITRTLTVRVGPASTIQVLRNTYSVPTCGARTGTESTIAT
jgi:hypothetical protein